MQTERVELSQVGGDSTEIRIHSSTPESVSLATSSASLFLLIFAHIRFTFREYAPQNRFHILLA